MTSTRSQTAVSALLAQDLNLERASSIDAPRLPVLPVFERLLPGGGLRPGTSTQIRGPGATTLALSLISAASKEAWTAVVGIPALGLRAADELGVDLDHLVVIADPGKRWTDVLAAVVDSFDVVLTCPQLPGREARRLVGRIRERDAVFVTVGPWVESDVRIETTRAASWHGIEDGHGHLAARQVEIDITGRRVWGRPVSARLWLPNADGEVSLVEPDNVVRLPTGPSA